MVGSLTGIIFWGIGACWLVASRAPMGRFGRQWWGKDVSDRPAADHARIMRRGRWIGGSMLLLAVAMAGNDLRPTYLAYGNTLLLAQWVLIGLGGVGMLIAATRPAPALNPPSDESPGGTP